ncbi:uncharacterized protein YBR072C-A [Saccharomyces cerevisiae S288C]|uniref:Uncharacterized protein YBR072C-A n=1 Tax=Saccharomyces cerevisiae (strain ATCC 204508 / S288c) TaxID=559292 RepID=YB072_YEAST|eukprot:NP_878048.1 hypothetical protein YBR072C-A [Saccharomyces cerevisiae S288C]
MHILTRSSKNAFPRSRSRQDIHISSHIHRDTSNSALLKILVITRTRLDSFVKT